MTLFIAPSRDPRPADYAAAQQLLHHLLTAALLECCAVDEYARLCKTRLLPEVGAQVLDDLLAFAAKDPAAGRDLELIARTYTSFAAVLHYRLAHWLYRHDTAASLDGSVPLLPALLSRRGKQISGAELHYRAQIGARFILDHGVGTVIGETTQIGDDCYVLGGVTLGARGIGNNPRAPRHPRIGQRVQIGAFSSVLGPVRIGDDVFIGPGCVISKDVPPSARVQLRTQLQVTLES